MIKHIFDIPEHINVLIDACKELGFEFNGIEEGEHLSLDKLEVAVHEVSDFYRLGIEFANQMKKNEAREMMLRKLTRSENENVRILAEEILSGLKDWRIELRYTGSFMTAVLKGDFKSALYCADSSNRIALTRMD